MQKVKDDDLALSVAQEYTVRKARQRSEAMHGVSTFLPLVNRRVHQGAKH